MKDPVIMDGEGDDERDASRHVIIGVASRTVWTHLNEERRLDQKKEKSKIITSSYQRLDG